MSDAVIVSIVSAAALVISAIVVRLKTKDDKVEVLSGIKTMEVKFDGKMDKLLVLTEQLAYARRIRDEKTRADAERGSKM